MSPITLTIITVVIIAALMIIQRVVSSLNNGLLGSIIPIIIVIAALYTFLVAKIPFGFKSCLVFGIPFVWSLEEWNSGRQRVKAKKEKEIELMKIKDIS